MSGDLSNIEICEICENESEDYSVVDGLVICESCKENSSLEKEEDNSSNVCALCGWPINRVIKKNEVNKFINGIESWLNKNNGLSTNIKLKIEKLKGKDLYFCRYDFFYLVKDIIEAENESLANKFEKEIASKYDFYGGIVS
jgi:hypothetical protein